MQLWWRLSNYALIILQKLINMPIEIRELVIKVAVDENNKKAKEGIDPKDLARLKDRIVKECMENIMLKMGNLSDR
jgi:hypothetical protein